MPRGKSSAAAAMRRQVASRGAAKGSRNPNGASVSTLPPSSHACANRRAVEQHVADRRERDDLDRHARPADSSSRPRAATGSGNSVAPATQPR